MYGIYCDSYCGPVFGGANDLFIPDNANTTYGSSRLGEKLISARQDKRTRSSQVVIVSWSQITRCLDSASDNY